jgi:23S rRNA U2552 (ribose-2'-O)-methylase RlmE/FtsJ
MWLQRLHHILVDLVALASATLRQPRESFQLIRTVPEMLAGSRLASNWIAQPTGEPSIESPPGSPGHNGSNPMADYFESHTEGRGIWKYSHYLDVYHRHFAKFIDQEVHVVEIGIFSGGSLDMWKQYFGPKARIYGVDIREECKVYAGDRVEVFVGDQADHGFWKRFKEKVPKVDILIDDGGHLPNQQIATLEEMLPHLRPGGVFVCEDTLSISARFPGYIHGMVRHLNAFAFRPSDLVVDASAFQSSIHSIHFYPYMTIIDKAPVSVEHFRLPMQGTIWEPIANAGAPEITISERPPV